MNKKNIEKKSNQVKDVANLINGYPTFLIFEYSSLTAIEISSMRKRLYGINALMRVFKNNILLRAFHTLEVKDYDQSLVGQNAIAFGSDASVIKIVGEVLKDKELAKVKVGRLDGAFLNTADVSRVVSLGSKTDLIVQFLSVMQAPIRQFLAVLSAVKGTK